MDIHELGEKTGVYLIEDFLSASECALIIRMSKKREMDKKIFDGKNLIVDPTEWNRLKDDETPTITLIQKRINKLTLFPDENGKHLRIIHYGTGGTFYDHNDFRPYYPDDQDPITAGCVAQMLFYLNDIEEGGETYFANLGVRVVPKRGRALLWYGVHGMYLPEKGAKTIVIPKNQKANPYAVHRPIPVVKGEKWVAAKFFHDRKQIRVNHKGKPYK